jgi:predicted lipid-binding transport protein (Tim44 family)
MHLPQGLIGFFGGMTGSMLWIYYAGLGVGDCMVLLFLAAALMMGAAVAAILRLTEKSAEIIDLLPQPKIITKTYRHAA